MLAITDRLPHERLRLGAVAADGVVAASVPAGFEAHLAALLTARAGALPDALDARRLVGRAGPGFLDSVLPLDGPPAAAKPRESRR